MGKWPPRVNGNDRMKPAKPPVAVREPPDLQYAFSQEAEDRFIGHTELMDYLGQLRGTPHRFAKFRVTDISSRYPGHRVCTTITADIGRSYGPHAYDVAFIAMTGEQDFNVSFFGKSLGRENRAGLDEAQAVGALKSWVGHLGDKHKIHDLGALIEKRQPWREDQPDIELTLRPLYPSRNAGF